MSIDKIANLFKRIYWAFVGWRKKYGHCKSCGLRAAQHLYSIDLGYPMLDKLMCLENDICHSCGKIHITGDQAYLIDKEKIKWRPLATAPPEIYTKRTK